MLSWNEFTAAAPTIAEVFLRRHTAAGNLCMLATLRADGSPRISPLEPRIFEDRLWIVGMPQTTKFADLARDPRFCLHTATVEIHPVDGDAKLTGHVQHVADPAQQERFAQHLYDQIGLDVRGQEFATFYAADLTDASTVTLDDGHLDITIWTPASTERVVRKH